MTAFLYQRSLTLRVSTMVLLLPSPWGRPGPPRTSGDCKIRRSAAGDLRHDRSRTDGRVPATGERLMAAWGEEYLRRVLNG